MKARGATLSLGRVLVGRHPPHLRLHMAGLRERVEVAHRSQLRPQVQGRPTERHLPGERVRGGTLRGG